jgi:hypothetical protein
MQGKALAFKLGCFGLNLAFRTHGREQIYDFIQDPSVGVPEQWTTNLKESESPAPGQSCDLSPCTAKHCNPAFFLPLWLSREL